MKKTTAAPSRASQGQLERKSKKAPLPRKSEVRAKSVEAKKTAPPSDRAYKAGARGALYPFATHRLTLVRHVPPAGAARTSKVAQTRAGIQEQSTHKSKGALPRFPRASDSRVERVKLPGPLHSALVKAARYHGVRPLHLLELSVAHKCGYTSPRIDAIRAHMAKNTAQKGGRK